MNLNYLAALGAGDIIISGLVLITAHRYGIARTVFVGYAVGLLAILLIGAFTGAALPALTTLVPALLISFVIGYVHASHLTWAALRKKIIGA